MYRTIRKKERSEVAYIWRKHMLQLEMNLDSDLFSNISEFICKRNELSPFDALIAISCMHFNNFLYNNSLQLSILLLKTS